jgi:glycosyltransferase involved in cell wall biosynthesis
MAVSISVVLTVFNKAAFLPDTLASLYRQEGAGSDFTLDFILVDDASTDASLAVSEAFFRENAAPFQLIRNERNQGPARRLNQGIEAAQGELIFVFDADDIAPANVLKTMLDLLQRDHLDYIYGRSAHTTESAAAAFEKRLPSPPDYGSSNAPLTFTLREGIVLPIVLVRRAVALKAGGCDGEVFIQDESLALRLALVARRAGLIRQPCRYVLMAPDETRSRPSAQHLSRNRAQQHHDQYLTYTHLLANPALPTGAQAAIARKAISPWWKSARERGFHPLVLLAYLGSRFMPRLVLRLARPSLDRYFAGLEGVRRLG